MLRNHCMRCGKAYTLADVVAAAGVPRCSCGGVIKPDVVLYEEALDAEVVDGAVRAIEHCDLLIVGGTSLVVYPAAGLLRYLPHTAKLVVINKSRTPSDDEADLVINESIDEVLGAVRV